MKYIDIETGRMLSADKMSATPNLASEIGAMVSEVLDECDTFARRESVIKHQCDRVQITIIVDRRTWSKGVSVSALGGVKIED